MGDINCIFCDIGKGKSPAAVEMDTDNVIAFKSINPAAEVHIIIAPKKHTPTFLDLDTKSDKVISEMMGVAQELIGKKEIKGGYKLTVNGGEYQVVPHLHWHLLGGIGLKNDIT